MQAIIEIEEIIKNQIKQSPRDPDLYVDLVKYYKEFGSIFFELFLVSILELCSVF